MHHLEKWVFYSKAPLPQKNENKDYAPPQTAPAPPPKKTTLLFLGRKLTFAFAEKNTLYNPGFPDLVKQQYYV